MRLQPAARPHVAPGGQAQRLWPHWRWSLLQAFLAAAPVFCARLLPVFFSPLPSDQGVKIEPALHCCLGALPFWK